MLNWLWNLVKKQPKKAEIEKFNEVLSYEEEALRRLKRISALRDDLYRDFEEQAEDRSEEVEEKTEGYGKVIKVQGKNLRILGRGR